MTTQELYDNFLKHRSNPKIPSKVINQLYDQYVISAYKDTLGGVQDSKYALPENMFQTLQAIDKFKGTDLESVTNNRRNLKQLFKELGLDAEDQKAALRYFKQHNLHPGNNPQQDAEQKIIQQVVNSVNNPVSNANQANLNPQPSSSQNQQVNAGNLENLTNNLQQQNSQQPSPQEVLSHVNANKGTHTAPNLNIRPNIPNTNFNFDPKNSRDINPQHQQQIPVQDLAKGRQRAASNGPEHVDVEIMPEGQGYGTNNTNNANNQQNFTWGAQNTQQNTPSGNNTMYGTAAGGPPGGPPPGPGGPGDLTGMFNRLKQGNLAGKYSPYINAASAIGQGIGAISNVSKIGQGASNLSDLKGQILNSYSAANAPYYNLDPSQMSKIRRLQRGYSDADKPGLGDAISNIGTNLPSILMQAGMGYLSGGAPGAIINGVGGLVNSGLEGVNKKQQQKAAELESLYGSLMQANAAINNRRMMQQPYIY